MYKRTVNHLKSNINLLHCLLYIFSASRKKIILNQKDGISYIEEVPKTIVTIASGHSNTLPNFNSTNMLWKRHVNCHGGGRASPYSTRRPVESVATADPRPDTYTKYAPRYSSK